MKTYRENKRTRIENGLLRIITSIAIAMLLSAVVTNALAEEADTVEDIEHAELEIVDAALADGVQDRKPIERGDTFEPGQKMVAWVTVKNPGSNSHVTLDWKKDGQSVWRIDLEVGKSPRWRTWARKTVRARDVGHWSIVIEDPSGNVLQTLEFDVIEADEGDA